MMLRDHLLALIAGFLLDCLLGDPEWLYHPVCLIGKYISRTERRLRQRGGDLRIGALWLTASTVLLTMASAFAVLYLLRRWGRMPWFAGAVLLDCLLGDPEWVGRGSL